MSQILKTIRKITPAPLIALYHLKLAWLASLRYGAPSKRLTVIGVTGTNGKTTVVHLLHEIFRAAGFKVGSVSSLRFKINDSETPNLLKMTMPGRFRLQKFLAECVKAGCRFAVVEVTSEGVKQSRHRFINFHSAVLTNVRPEHIEAHGGFEPYRDAKIKLFSRLPPSGFAVLNREDESSELFSEKTKAENVWYSKSLIDLKRVGHPVRVNVSSKGIVMEIDNFPLASRLEGDFNAMNILAAAAAAMAYGVSISAIAQALAVFGGVAGRMEYIQKEPFAVVVDYAHTPDALEEVYRFLSSKVYKGDNETYELTNLPTSKLICVLGAAGGGRDRWKRPEMGRIAARYCREVILTSEDPDDENPLRIMEEIERGFSSNPKSPAFAKASAGRQIPNYKKIENRREAIRTALQDAGPGDTVITTGMGAQPWFIEKGRRIKWDEREVVREELVKLKSIPTNYE